MLYDKRKEQIYEYYKRFKKIDLDNIQEVNDTIVDTLLKHEDFESDQDEFYNTLAMCKYMIENKLYDECFFNDYKDLKEEYDSFSFGSEDEKRLLDSDIEEVDDYLKKEDSEKEYYDKLTEVYNDNLK